MLGRGWVVTLCIRLCLPECLPASVNNANTPGLTLSLFAAAAKIKAQGKVLLFHSTLPHALLRIRRGGYYCAYKRHTQRPANERRTTHTRGGEGETRKRGRRTRSNRQAPETLRREPGRDFPGREKNRGRTTSRANTHTHTHTIGPPNKVGASVIRVAPPRCPFGLMLYRHLTHPMHPVFVLEASVYIFSANGR